MGKTIATNKKAYRDYALTQKMECGIELIGAEVKSIRAGYVNFKDSFARIEKEQAFLYNLHVDPYQPASYMNQEPDRKRRLLAHKKDIRKLASAMNEKGLILIPTQIYINDRGFVKVEIALGKGKKLYDKREDVKKRSIDRSLKRTLRNYR